MAKKKGTMKKAFALVIIFITISMIFNVGVVSAGDKKPGESCNPGSTNDCIEGYECAAPDYKCTEIKSLGEQTSEDTEKVAKQTSGDTNGLSNVPAVTQAAIQILNSGEDKAKVIKMIEENMNKIIKSDMPNADEILNELDVTKQQLEAGMITPEDALKKTKEIEQKIDQNMEKGKSKSALQKLIPCSGTSNSANPVARGVDCTADIITSILSVVGGIRMGVVLSALKGSCKAETSLKGLTAAQQEAACKSCNADPLRLCTLERCMILGNCIPVPPETGEEQANYRCIPGKCEETGTVSIDIKEVYTYKGGEETSMTDSNSAKDKFEVNGDVTWNSDSIKIVVGTDILAQCRYSFEPQQDFESMTDFDENYFPGTYDKPEPQEVTIPLPGSMARGEKHTIYIKCKNVCGIAHDKADDNHFVRFTFEKKPEQLPPQIVYTDPMNGGVVSGDLTTMVISFQLDEKGYCKYSDNWTKGEQAPLTTKWEDMINFEGPHEPNSAVISGKCTDVPCEHLRNEMCSYCNLTLDMSRGFTNLSWDKLPPELQNELEMTRSSKWFHFKIRCQDVGKNIMLEEDTLDYNFFTMPPYSIDIKKPVEGEALYDVHPEINVVSDERSTECRYEAKKLASGQDCSIRYEPSWDKMTDIDGQIAKEHSGIVQETLEPSVQGTPYCLYVKCRDTWLLEKSDKVFFKLYKDEKEPVVARVYHDTLAGDYLLLETNEESTCKYSIDDEIGCSFNFDEGQDMTGVNETMHTTYWTLEHLFYVKCVDIWGNYAGGSKNSNKCTAIINPFEIPSIPR